MKNKDWKPPFKITFSANVLTSEVEESRLLLDTAERAKRNLEQEVMDSRTAISELTNVNSALTGEKRRLEGDVSKKIIPFKNFTWEKLVFKTA